MSDRDFAPPFRPSENKIPPYPENPDPDTGVPSFPWILTSPGDPFHHIPSFPATAWWIPSPPPRESPHFVPNSHKPEGPFFSLNAPLPTAAEPYVVIPQVSTRVLHHLQTQNLLQLTLGRLSLTMPNLLPQNLSLPLLTRWVA